MNLDQYNAFTNSLVERLIRDDRVISLIAVGSMAQQDQMPDQWSDHDFFVIVHTGQQDAFRAQLNWLPDGERIVYSYSETQHGVKVIYEDGHLLEFAVFDRNELHLARINRYRVLFDHQNVETDILQIVSETARWAESLRSDDRYLCGQFLTNVLIASGRYRRGEKLSGLFLLYGSAIRHLTLLLSKYLPPTHVLDNIDPLRRFEAAYPDLAAELRNGLTADVSATSITLLDLAERELGNHIPEDAKRAIHAIRSTLGRI